MIERLDYYSYFKEAFQKLSEIGGLLETSKLDKKLLHLVKIRASQINHCVFCVDMHTKQAKIAGEKEIRLYHLSCWDDSPLFTPIEKAALMWTEAVTKVNQMPISDEVYEKVCEYFSSEELVQLTMAIVLINSWNRLAGVFKSTPGSLDKAYGLDKAGLS